MIRRVKLRLMHIVDEATAEDGARLLSLLLNRLPVAEIEQEVVAVGRLPAVLAVPAQTPCHRVGQRFGRGFAWGVDIQRLVKARRPDVLHAWSMGAATAAGMAIAPGRLAVTLCDPAEAHVASRWWRSGEIVVGGAVVCSSRLVQRRLIEAGVKPEATLVIRPGVDFGAIRAAREKPSRAQFGLPPEGRVLLTASPPSREGGHFLALWAMAILHQLWPDARLIVPGESREQRRLARLIREVYCPEVFLLVGDRFQPAELLAVADTILVPATADIPMGWLASAMAASVPVIGAAVPAVAELIADRHNGFLHRPGEVHALAVRVRTVFDSPELMRQCAETARGQAYDVFRAQACVEQYLRLFRNMSAGRAPGEGVRDTAMDT